MAKILAYLAVGASAARVREGHNATLDVDLDTENAENSQWFFSRRRRTHSWNGCSGGRSLPNGITNADAKGLTVDDKTMAQCTDNIITKWPHTSNTPVRAIRLYSAWSDHLDSAGSRQDSWDGLVDMVHNNDVQVLLGVGIGCDHDDDKRWQYTLELLELLGADNVLGVSIGNELDNMENNQVCWRQQIWDDNGFIHTFRRYVGDLDRAGFSHVKVMTVWGLGVLSPEGNAIHHNFQSFLTAATEEYGDRFVWAFNPKPIFDTGLVPESEETCSEHTIGATNVDYVKGVMTTARRAVTALTGNSNAHLWVTEVGWSSPGVQEQAALERICPEWSSPDTYWRFFKNMMEWDLSLDHGEPAVERMFYFTMRDTPHEGFGLVSGCGDDVSCKITR